MQVYRRIRNERFDRPRRGFSLFEVQVALVIFGIALVGFGPVSIMYTREFKRLNDRFDPDTTYYLVPSTDRWVRKLDAAATITTQDPGTLTIDPSIPTPNVVTIESVDKTIAGEEVTAMVTVEPSQ
jgi:prepilin-type N-terminal cleavage/methylation domain-containing protein